MEPENVQTELLEVLEAHWSTSPSEASESSEDQVPEMQDELLELLQQQSQALSPDLGYATSKESDKMPRRRQQKPRIQLQPNSVSFAFGGKSTLRGTPWEDALCGVTPQTGELRSTKTGKPVQRTVKETEIVAFWTQFFG